MWPKAANGEEREYEMPKKSPRVSRKRSENPSTGRVTAERRPAGVDLERRKFPSLGLPTGSPRKDARAPEEERVRRTPAGDDGGRAVTPVVRVLLVEDHAIFRELFASAFEREPGLEVVAQAGSLAEAREALEEGVDVAVLDLRLPDGEGTDLIGELRENNPHAAALILTASLDHGTYARAVAAGAAGALHKSVYVGEVMHAIRRLAAGEALLSKDEVVTLLRLADRERTQSREARVAFGQLTPREWDVLHALAEGLGDKEIAQRLGCGLGTVRGHGSRMLAKLGAHSRLQALVYAARHGFVEIGGGPAGGPR